ncbi:MAG: hypothetical protein R3Y43_01345 [Alphaproteobacteria bacterium]
MTNKNIELFKNLVSTQIEEVKQYLEELNMFHTALEVHMAEYTEKEVLSYIVGGEPFGDNLPAKRILDFHQSITTIAHSLKKH